MVLARVSLQLNGFSCMAQTFITLVLLLFRGQDRPGLDYLWFVFLYLSKMGACDGSLYVKDSDLWLLL